jgi:hypothetical protein
MTDKEKLLNMPERGVIYLNWFADGGAEIFKVNYSWYILFDIPQYGGEPTYAGTFHETQLDNLIETYKSWT